MLFRSTSTYEALDWIAVTEILAAKGYTRAQIESLYEVRVRELSDSGYANEQHEGKYTYSSPYARMLEKVQAKDVKRGLASE